MRIVQVNWAPLAKGALTGGGVNGYCAGLCRGLSARGHDVIHLSSGRAYTRDARPMREDEEPTRVGTPEVRRADDFGGVRVFEVVNSPVLAPASSQFRDPLPEIASPALEREIARFFALLRPDVVHFHNIEGLSSGCVRAVLEAAQDHRPKVYYSLHNYHTVCAQVNLMRGAIYPCSDFENGHLCTSCIGGGQPALDRRGRVNGDSVPRNVRAASNGSFLTRLFVRGCPPLARPGRPVQGPEDMSPAASLVIDQAKLAAERLMRQPLDNEVPFVVANPRPMALHGKRRQAMVMMLNQCDRVLAVSEFVRLLYESMGVRSELLHTLDIGTRMMEIATPFVSRGPRKSGDPLRLAFLGFNLPHKGLPMLLDSLELLPPAILARLALHIHAVGAASIEGRLGRLRGLLAEIEVRDAYKYEDLPAILHRIDIGVVPSIWWDNGPQTVMEFLACGVPVLGARLGGIPDLVHDGVNGILFRGNDREDLARALTKLASHPELAAALRAGVRPPKSMSEHVLELEAQYQPCGTVPVP